MQLDKGVIIVIAAPGGTGKGTVIKQYLETYTDTLYSISCTSRAKRENDNVSSYYYVSKEEFENMIKNDELLEYVMFCDNYYGTPKKYIIDEINKNNDVLLELEYIGALNVKQKFAEAKLIFLLPPNFDELYNRLHNRGTDSEERIHQRLSKAKEEVLNAKKFDYLVINDKIDDTIELIRAITIFEKEKESCREDLREMAEACSAKYQKNIDFIDDFLNELNKKIN